MLSSGVITELFVIHHLPRTGLSTKLRAAALAAMLLSASVLAVAQVDTGSILGTVNDTTGAVVPGATVTLTSTDTGLVQTTTSGSTGEYTFSPVKIGHYSVAAEFKGFQRVQHTHV